MERVENGSFVSVEYKGTLSNGEVFDTSSGNRPLEVKMGAGSLIKGFEDALIGMSLHEKKTFTIEPGEAYGERDENLKKSFSRKDLPDGMDPEVGQVVSLTSPQGRQMPGRISEVSSEAITIDLNHPLAGESLTFEVKVVGISDEPNETVEECGTNCCSDCSSGCR